ncbi:uncharacterized protein LOC135114441 [Scylla paramamosain]|uniref:uncharacterized protein LOC135114441 n=1 Tax=Scylla paramamosain TaxID=85552 RepID=UPI003083D6A4
MLLSQQLVSECVRLATCRPFKGRRSESGSVQYLQFVSVTCSIVPRCLSRPSTVTRIELPVPVCPLTLPFPTPNPPPSHPHPPYPPTPTPTPTPPPPTPLVPVFLP